MGGRKEETGTEVQSEEWLQWQEREEEVVELEFQKELEVRAFVYYITSHQDSVTYMYFSIFLPPPYIHVHVPFPLLFAALFLIPLPPSPLPLPLSPLSPAPPAPPPPPTLPPPLPLSSLLRRHSFRVGYLLSSRMRSAIPNSRYQCYMYCSVIYILT